MSGMAAACELKQRGYQVLVVEARQRVGGRLKGGELRLSEKKSQHVDLGGALIHGIDENPIADLVDQIGIPTKPVADCLLLDKSGWPVDPKEDEKISTLFNDCLEESFQRAADKQSDTSFGDLFEQVCKEKSVNPSSLLKWHQANLEVSCGASFHQLGWQWNEDEPYGFDGEHVALETSWKAVVDAMAEGLDILYDSPVARVHVVHPKPTASNHPVPISRPIVSTVTEEAKNIFKKKKETTPVLSPSRQSRRLRGEDASARRSLRATKGKGVNRFTVDPAEPQQLKQKRARHDPAEHGPKHSVVQVTLQNGTVLEADSVICTLPLGILKTKSIQFEPPLPETKQQAIQRLGTGLLNKCALAFDKIFWQDSDFLGLTGEEHSYLVLNVSTYTRQPVLLFMYGGAFAKGIEDWTDTEVVEDCLQVLKKFCGRQIPQPVDYQVTRWGHEQYSRMAFTYIPPGVDGTTELQAMSQPILDSMGEIPVLQFAGEHTTPYHPSTIHGAFLSGIREAYRLDIALEPEANDNLEFSGEHIYKRTFSVKRKFKETTGTAVLKQKSGTSGHAPGRRQHRRRGAAGVMQLRRKPRKMVENGSKPQATNDVQPSPGRRSQRSLAQKSQEGTFLNGMDGIDSSDNNNEPVVDLDALEDRVLVRGVESYGRDFAYVRNLTLPVHGSSRLRTLAQVRDRCRRLLFGMKKQRSYPSSTNAWRASVAKIVYPPSNVPSKASGRSKTRKTAAPNVAARENRGERRSSRLSKPRVFFDD